MKKLYANQCMIIYQFLKDNCVGNDNAMGGKLICQKIMDNPKTRKYFPNGLDKVDLQMRINAIRKDKIPNKSITRRIGSSPKGYWLDTKKDNNGIDFLKKLACSHIVTAVKSGVKVEYFYQLLNQLENEMKIDGQIKIKVIPYANDNCKVFSDDLLNN